MMTIGTIWQMVVPAPNQPTHRSAYDLASCKLHANAAHAEAAITFLSRRHGPELSQSDELSGMVARLPAACI